MAADEANLQWGKTLQVFFGGEYLISISEALVNCFSPSEAICMGELGMRDLCLRTDTKTNAARFSAGPVESFSNMVVPQ